MRTIVELREHLFDAIEGLLDDDEPIDIDRANAVANVAQAIVASARVECAYLELLGGEGTGFVPDEAAKEAPGNQNVRLVGPRS